MQCLPFVCIKQWSVENLKIRKKRVQHCSVELGAGTVLWELKVRFRCTRACSEFYNERQCSYVRATSYLILCTQQRLTTDIYNTKVITVSLQNVCK